MTLQEIFEKVKMEHARSMLKYGKWTEIPKDEQRKAIRREVREWITANRNHDIHGPHGEIVEAIQVMNVMARRIMYLTGEDA